MIIINMQNIKFQTYTHNLPFWVCLLIIISCNSKKEQGPININSHVPPSLFVYIFNREDSSNIFKSSEDSINLVFPYPNNSKLTFGKLVDFGPNNLGPYLQCGMLVTYSAIDNIKSSYLFYNNKSIPDTLIVDYQVKPNLNGYRGYDYIPVEVKLNSSPAKFGIIKESWLVYK
jgi:hypothetical protein